MAFNTYTANVFLPGCLGPVKREVVLAEDAETALAASRMLTAEDCAKLCGERAAYWNDYDGPGPFNVRAGVAESCADVIRNYYVKPEVQANVKSLRARIAELENEILELLQGDEV